MKAQEIIKLHVRQLPVKTPHFILEDDGQFPNSRLPVILYKSIIDLPGRNAAAVMEKVFEYNGWTNSWRNGIYNYHHYHSITHEVLGIYSGQCDVVLGGNDGINLTIAPGDVLIIPAGVAHKNAGSTENFKCIGAYPAGKNFDINTGKTGERPITDKNIAMVPMPATDPVFGYHGFLQKLWH